MTFDYDIWQKVGDQLAEFKWKKHYLQPEQYAKGNPMEVLTPPSYITTFFGTKVLNIFIVGIPYGWTQSGTDWTEDWPPEGFDDLVTSHKLNYSQFTKYETHIYMDFNLVKKIMADSPDSKFETMMTAVKGHMENLCNDLAEYGFKLEADITSEVDADFFKDIIEAFYRN